MALSTKFVNRNLTFSKESADFLDLLQRDEKRLGALSQDEVRALKSDVGHIRLDHHLDTSHQLGLDKETQKRYDFAKDALHNNLEGYKSLQEMHLANDEEKTHHFGRAFYHFKAARDYHDGWRELKDIHLGKKLGET